MPKTEKSGKKATTCICPRCEKKFKIQMRWRGNGIPRKLCSQCRRVAVECDYGVDYSLNLELSHQPEFL